MHGIPSLSDEQLTNLQLQDSAIARCYGQLSHDPQLEAIVASAADLAYIGRAQHSIAFIAAACARYATRQCLGTRAWESDGTGGGRYLPRFDSITYDTLWKRVQGLATGLRKAELATTGDFIGICGFGSPDWLVADLACLYLAAVSVPLQTTLVPDDLQHIINETQMRVLVCSSEQIALVKSVLPRCPYLQTLVIMDVNAEDATQAAALAEHTACLPAGCTLLYLAALQQCTLAPIPYAIPGRDTADADPLLNLMYTSGSTGSPKGAMYVESIVVESFRQGISAFCPMIPMVGVAYQPLNHVTGRMAVFQALMQGGCVNFVLKSDMSTLFEDMRLSRPTYLLLVPRVSEMIYQHFQGQVIKKMGADTSSAGRLLAVNAVIQEMRSTFLGDRLCYAICSTAPTAPEITTFLRNCFQIPVFDVYGATENGIVTVEHHIAREHVTDYKLLDVPELGYTTRDTPYPRGELLIKSPRAIPGYFKNTAASEALRNDEGFVCTGDIVEERGPDHVVWIDRKRNILKLAQGEYVSVSRLEGMYVSKSPFIEQIYIYGNSARAYLLAVLVPNAEAIASLGVTPDSANGDLEIRALLRAELGRIARAEQVPGYEVPRDFLLESLPFTRENGLLTESNKPVRMRLKAAYGERLEALYRQIESQSLAALAMLMQSVAGDVPVAQRVRQAIGIILGVPDIDVQDPRLSFVKLGGDSLSAVRLSALLEDACGITVPVGVVLDPTLSIKGLVQRIEQAGTAPPPAATYLSVHGAATDEIDAGDLRLDTLLPGVSALAAAARPADALPATAKNILLTGASGFLGRFLLLELLTRVEQQDGQLVCIVRAPDDVAAATRLRIGYATNDALVERFETALRRGRLRVLAGDVTSPQFGLVTSTYAALAQDIDCVVHSGALVNHALTYAQLFDPNVMGTVEVLRFALCQRIKAFNFVSTLAVLGPLQRATPVYEHEHAAQLWPRRPIGQGYAAGYGASKWAAEVLLREACERFAMPVKVFRCSMITAHTEERGQVNASDMITRLLCGLIDTGCAPRSFYADNFAGARHFDGTPVDVVAHGIAAIAAGTRPGYQILHVANAHWDDGVSLDRIVDWVQSAGYAVRRMPDYDAWYATFCDALRHLDTAHRQHSPLPIVAQWERPIGLAEVRMDTTGFKAALRRCAGVEDVPVLDETYFHLYLAHMVHAGLIPATLQGRRAQRDIYPMV